MRRIALPAQIAGPNPRSPSATVGEVAPARFLWVDLLKGFGILMVVFGHALGGLIDAGYDPANRWYRPLFAAIYVFHMPLFFFLTGLFVVKRLERNRERFQRQLFSQVMWPYFLWGSIQVTAIFAAGNLVNSPIGPLGTVLPQIFYIPPSQFWFLFGLFFLHGLSLLAGRHAGDPLYLLFFFAVASFGEAEQLPGISSAIAQMAPYYGLGVFFGERLLAPDRDEREDRMWLWSVPFALVALPLTLARALETGTPDEWPTQAAEIVKDINGFVNFYAAGIILVALIAVARVIGSRAPRWIIYCGERTMPIFVMHILCLAPVRIILVKYYPAMPPPLMLPILVTAGIVLPLTAAVIADRVGAARWLGFR